MRFVTKSMLRIFYKYNTEVLILSRPPRAGFLHTSTSDTNLRMHPLGGRYRKNRNLSAIKLLYVY